MCDYCYTTAQQTQGVLCMQYALDRFERDIDSLRLLGLQSPERM